MSDGNNALRTARSHEDGSIVQRVVAGERAAFELLMRRYNRRLYRLARATLGDPQDAQDALQEAYLSAYRSLAQFRGDSSLATWLSRLVLNECLGRLRRSRRRQNVIPMIQVAADAELDPASPDDSGSPVRAATRAQMREILERKIDALPESFRAVFILRSVEELTVEETAECLGIPAETVRSRHFRAKALLREAMARDVDLAERDVFEFGGSHCDQIVSQVLTRISTDQT